MSARILLVDDSITHRDALRQILEQAGYVIAGEASNGVDAVDAFRALRPELVIMDLVLPQQNGVDATREIMGVDPAARVIVISGLAQPSVQGEALAAGAVAFVAKPIDRNDLLSELKDALGTA